MADLRLVLRGVSLGFGEFGLQRVSLELPPSEVGVIAGLAATGKTTLLEVAAGIRRPDSGQVLIGGRALGGMSERQLEDLYRREVAWASRDGAQATGMKRVLDYVSLPLAGWELGSTEPERRGRAALRRLGVEECAEQEWSELATTQQVYVELAQAIVRGPSLLLADSLLDGMSRNGRRQVMMVLRELAGELSCGVLVTTDDLDLGARADRVWSLEEGKLTPYGHRDNTTVVDLNQHRHHSAS
jgi:putative ABC transport system ATP-binding protein